MRRRSTGLLLVAIASGCALDSTGAGPTQASSAGGSTGATTSSVATTSTSASTGAAGGSGGDAGAGAGGGGAGGAGGVSGSGGLTGSGGTGGATPLDPWWDPAFTRRTKITFDKAPSPEDLVGFQVMIALDGTIFDYGASAGSAGNDIRFVDDDGSTVLPYEIERWSENGASFLWVRVPQIDAGSVVDHIWLYYANAGAAAGQNAQQVWGNTHVGVYHLAQDPGGPVVLDSTSAGNDGATAGNMNSGDLVAGIVGDAFDFDGTDDYVALGGVHVPEFEVDPGQARTIEAWINTTTTDRKPMTDEASCSGWGIDMTQSGALAGRLFLGTNGCPSPDIYILVSPSSYADGAWHYAALVIDRPSASMRFYVDGGLVAMDGSLDNNLPVGGWYDRIGTNHDNSRPFDGRIDEVRVATVARSTAWIAAQHASMTNAFATFGPTRPAP